MNALLTASAAAGPLAAGWSLHTLLLRRRVERARRDPLTGLPGRDAFTTTARRRLRAPGGVVVLVDLDGFKQVNDAHGHAAGDEVLASAAKRLAVWSETRGGCAGRLGGDEFAATITCPAPSDLPFELDALHDALTSPVPFRGAELDVGASIGAFAVAGLPEPVLGPALRRADEAMYAAKRGGGGWHVADGPIPVMTTTNGRRTGRPGTNPRSGGSR
ncbi:GGDEF domain-containing protein [Streptomyces netropsis]|uniref:Diguanylate cyclase (GGDEF)-like protein n=1 Tax=Streptomyces netropsis TaxID=55404 RepID=A0A7W7LFR8_STRNE|nr:GGDEF domain-containing protein [Streptomyces netropsis]MBB4889314.1 diguanylate cyclase (GGDEF)-like protein [Streptomyces netropsis]GGR39260.1 GGDEF domain-containing protein [Streptomyces netropsis]